MDKDRIGGTVRELAGKAEGAAGSFAGDGQMQNSGRAREAVGVAQNIYGQAKDAARDAGEAAVSYARDAVENSGDAIQSGSRAVARTMKDNPVGSLLIAGCIGFALALLITRSGRRSPRERYYG